MNTPLTIFWYRRDLRLEDNAGLYHALKNAKQVLPLFIFDTEILDDLEEKKDARVTFIYKALLEIKRLLEEQGSSLLVAHGHPLEVWKQLVKKYTIEAVYTNHDYEPYAKERDKVVQQFLEEQAISFYSYKDQVIFERDEVVKEDSNPYVVFTPYSRRWLEKLDSKLDENNVSFYLRSYPTSTYHKHLAKLKALPMLSLRELGFERSDIQFPEKVVARKLIRDYASTRNFPAQDGTSQLSVHFRFGTISIREKARRARQLSNTFLNELIWRDFYAMILDHFPKVVDAPFRAKYSFIEWRNNESEFEAWCTGRTGYPMVDAGMRQLNATGWMHNRVRMITASFLTKHLLVDWRWGETYFAKKLIDFDLASNNGGWQWAAGCGTDAAPYFRIFNPAAQQKKFDPDEQYIRQWVPEYGSANYPKPIVEHKAARERCLATYKKALDEANVKLED